MTYLERITYLVGEVMEVSQYALKNAYFVMALTEAKSVSPHGDSALVLVSSQARAKELLLAHEFLGAEKQIADLQGQGLSVKDEASLAKLLRKRDYLSTYFFVDNASSLAREEVAVYESKIQELNDLVTLGQSLVKSLTRSQEILLAGLEG